MWPGLGAGPWSPRGLCEEGAAGVRGGRRAARGPASGPHSARAGPSSESCRHWPPQTLLRRRLAAPGSRPYSGPPAGCPADGRRTVYEEPQPVLQGPSRRPGARNQAPGPRAVSGVGGRREAGSSESRRPHKASRETDVAPGGRAGAAPGRAPPPRSPCSSARRRSRPPPIGRGVAARAGRCRARPVIGHAAAGGGVSVPRPALASARCGARGGSGGAWQVRRARGGGGLSPAQPRPVRPPGPDPGPLARLARRAAAPPRLGASRGSGAADRAQAWP